ncbi:helix-turn-helix domain-containing protein [Vibrio splendidus]|uniref:helix-turn-helix domain-containing protein n=1 Tax=Vibrio splendidus TaxID=29497 RepID=UPI000D353F58|nr:helix-turn-helix transcriptional regulator [Vibrio splendidus]PTP39503.1 XRE family transcriptional regulator [Vibrio splendidus]CAH7000181.1 HTH cro/C1-type domain-containing protein [Vibrio chagasii]
MNARDMFFQEGTVFSNAEEKAFARDDLVYTVTEDLLMIMEDKGVSKAELARKLSKSKSYVTQVLSGSRNMTLGSLSDICFALGVKPNVILPVELPEKPERKTFWSNVTHVKKVPKYKKEANVYKVDAVTWNREKKVA